jgi:hypothetical protein
MKVLMGIDVTTLFSWATAYRLVAFSEFALLHIGLRFASC